MARLLRRNFDAIFDARLARGRRVLPRRSRPTRLARRRRNVMRQALAGMLWCKQFYYYDVDKWLDEHAASIRSRPAGRLPRNNEWFHMINDDIISMPDKWEYPWYAAWDLAFHTLAAGDGRSGLRQGAARLLMLRESVPASQRPDSRLRVEFQRRESAGACLGHAVPVSAWKSVATARAIVDFLKRAFNKLLLNFTWWVNRKDRSGKNVFEGGFLGLDNIGVFDRSAPLPTGRLPGAGGRHGLDGLFCQNMLEIASELAAYDPVYEDMAMKFVEHFLWIAAAMNRMGGQNTGMWDEEDGFYLRRAAAA